MDEPTTSDRLIEELAANGVIRKDHNKIAAKLIICKFLEEVFKRGITDERCAINKTLYQRPTFND